MNILSWQPCDVFDLINNRFGWTPVKVETFANRTYYNATGLSSQNNINVWRPNEEIFSIGAPSSSLKFPLFFGTLDIQIGNSDPVGSSIANAYLIITNAVLQNINLSVPFYNLQAGTLQRYGIGSFAGRAFPAAGIVNEWNNEQPLLMLSPFITIEEFTDGTGAIFAEANLSFSGFRIDMI